jgi:phosphoglycerate kinase
VAVLLPTDHIVAEDVAGLGRHEVQAGAITGNLFGVDIGPETRLQFAAAIAAAKTVVWNGPPGIFEVEQYAGGTIAIAEAMAKHGPTTIVGGGDTAAAVDQFEMASQMTHVSTGGGASLELMEGKILPGIAALEKAAKPPLR